MYAVKLIRIRNSAYKNKIPTKLDISGLWVEYSGAARMWCKEGHKTKRK